MKKYFAFIILFFIPVIYAQTVSHNASQIKPGVFGELFGGGNYIFPNSVSIGGNIFEAKLVVIGTNSTFIVRNNTNVHLFVNGTTGNVGIGTTAPTTKLQVHESGNFNSQLTISTNSENYNSILAFTTNASGNPKDARIGLDTANSVLKLVYGAPFASSTNGIMIDSSGRVGIGTSTPKAKLEIQGTGVGGLSLNVTNDLFVNDTTGNVGIGIINPGQKLDVSGNIRSNGEIISTLGSGSAQFRAIAGNYGFMIRNDGSNTYFLLTNSGDQYGTWNTLRPFTVSVSSGDVSLGIGALYVQHGGNVGIGTSSPDSKLHIIGGVCIESSDSGCSQAAGTLKATTIYEGSTQLSSKYVSRSDWTTIDNYPAGCSSGQFVQAIGDTLTCASPTFTFSGARVRNSANWWGNNIYLTWDTEDYDTDNYHSTTTNTERLTIPATGYYAFGATIGHMPPTGGSGGHWSIVKNRAQTIAAQRIEPSSENSNMWHQLSGSGYFVAGDYIEVYFGYWTGVTVLSSGSLYLSNAPNAAANFWIFRIK